MKPQGMTLERSSTWAEFCIWAVVGVIFGFALLIFPTLGVVLVLIGLGLAATRRALRRSWFGALAGVGATLLYVAFVQRHGPGIVCWQTATESGCDEYLNPWPWLVAGAALVVAGLVAQARRIRAGSPRSARDRQRGNADGGAEIQWR
jgi:hypothetical protein